MCNILQYDTHVWQMNWTALRTISVYKKNKGHADNRYPQSGLTAAPWHIMMCFLNSKLQN